MLAKLAHLWRIVATGIGFLCFGAGCLVLRLVIFPAISLFVFDPQRKKHASRQAIRLGFAVFIGIVCRLGVIRYRISGHDRLRRSGLLIVANHPSLIDTIFLMILARDTNCIVKSSLSDNPFILGPVRAACYIKNSASGEALVDESIDAIRRGENLIIFPEGTRTPEDGRLHFRRGAANIAIRGGINITPVFIRCRPRILGKNTAWWQIPALVTEYHIDVQGDIAVRPFVENAKNDVLAVRTLTQHLQNYFNKGHQENAFT